MQCRCVSYTYALYCHPTINDSSAFTLHSSRWWLMYKYTCRTYLRWLLYIHLPPSISQLMMTHAGRQSMLHLIWLHQLLWSSRYTKWSRRIVNSHPFYKDYFDMRCWVAVASGAVVDDNTLCWRADGGNTYRTWNRYIIKHTILNPHLMIHLLAHIWQWTIIKMTSIETNNTLWYYY